MTNGDMIMDLKYRLLLAEKRFYPFRRWPRVQARSVLFPGCGFAAQFPRTLEALERLCAEHGAPVAHDCCGSPFGEAGLVEDAARFAEKLNARLDKLGVREVIVVCPNCQRHMRDTLDVPVVSIYRKLGEWGVALDGIGTGGFVFHPCPERERPAMWPEIEPLLAGCELASVSGVPCCGLRGDIASRGPEPARKLCAKAQRQVGEDPLYVYCASCGGQFARHGLSDVRHVLSALLGVDERPDCDHSIKNRVVAKMRKPAFLGEIAPE